MNQYIGTHAYPLQHALAYQRGCNSAANRPTWRDSITRRVEYQAFFGNFQEFNLKEHREHKETADQTQIGSFIAFFVISVVKNLALLCIH